MVAESSIASARSRSGLVTNLLVVEEEGVTVTVAAGEEDEEVQRRRSSDQEVPTLLMTHIQDRVGQTDTYIYIHTYIRTYIQR